MTTNEARRIIRRFFSNTNPTEDDEFLFIEAASFLIETENDVDTMVNLGGYYYDKQKYELAEKYYLMAEEAGDDWVANGLGFIYYYGRVGEPDYKKAFYYFSKAKEQGVIEAEMKLADMYHHGYGIEKDDAQYKKILLDIYARIKDTTQLFDPYPEVAHRLAEIYIEEGHKEDALPLLEKGKSYIAQRIRYNAFWGNFIVCRRVITLLYQVKAFDERHFDFFDLFYLLAKPHKVRLYYDGEEYVVESFIDEDALRVKCGEQYYKSIEAFLMNALFHGNHTYVIDFESYYSLELID